MSEHTIKLRWPPTVNTYWRNVVMGKSSRVLISKKGRRYRAMAAHEIMLQGMTGREIEGRLSVHIQASPPDRRKRDLDNLPKSVLDALTYTGVWNDDSQIDDLRITRHQVKPGGEIVVTIKTIEDQANATT